MWCRSLASISRPGSSTGTCHISSAEQATVVPRVAYLPVPKPRHVFLSFTRFLPQVLTLCVNGQCHSLLFPVRRWSEEVNECCMNRWVVVLWERGLWSLAREWACPAVWCNAPPLYTGLQWHGNSPLSKRDVFGAMSATCFSLFLLFLYWYPWLKSTCIPCHYFSTIKKCYFPLPFSLIPWNQRRCVYIL